MADTIFEEANNKGYSKHTMYNAKKELKIKATRNQFGSEGKWFWELKE